MLVKRPINLYNSLYQLHVYAGGGEGSRVVSQNSLYPSSFPEQRNSLWYYDANKKELWTLDSNGSKLCASVDNNGEVFVTSKCDKKWNLNITDNTITVDDGRCLFATEDNNGLTRVDNCGNIISNYRNKFIW